MQNVLQVQLYDVCETKLTKVMFFLYLFDCTYDKNMKSPVARTCSVSVRGVDAGAPAHDVWPVSTRVPWFFRLGKCQEIIFNIGKRCCSSLKPILSYN